MKTANHAKFLYNTEVYIHCVSMKLTTFSGRNNLLDLPFFSSLNYYFMFDLEQTLNCENGHRSVRTLCKSRVSN